MTLSMPIPEVVETETRAVEDRESQVVEIEDNPEPAYEPISLSAQARERLTVLNRMLESSVPKEALNSDSASEAESEPAER